MTALRSSRRRSISPPASRHPYGLSGGGRAVTVLTRFGERSQTMMPSLGESDDYYSATLILLSKIAFSERF